MAFWIISPEAGRELFFLAVIVFVGWFAAGTLVNVREGNSVTRWIQEGLPVIGEKATHRWLGSSGIEMKIEHPGKPLSRVEIFILFEPRDVPILWAYFHARGRRDILIVRCETSSPRFQLEAYDPAAWSTRDAQREFQRKQWVPIELPPATHLFAHGEGRLETAAALIALATNCGLPLVRLRILRAAPQLEVQWRLSGFQKYSSRRIFEALYEISKRL